MTETMRMETLITYWWPVGLLKSNNRLTTRDIEVSSNASKVTTIVIKVSSKHTCSQSWRPASHQTLMERKLIRLKDMRLKREHTYLIKDRCKVTSIDKLICRPTLIQMSTRSNCNPLTKEIFLQREPWPLTPKNPLSCTSNAVTTYLQTRLKWQRCSSSTAMLWRSSGLAISFWRTSSRLQTSYSRASSVSLTTTRSLRRSYTITSESFLKTMQTCWGVELEVREIRIMGAWMIAEMTWTILIRGLARRIKIVGSLRELRYETRRLMHKV